MSRMYPIFLVGFCVCVCVVCRVGLRWVLGVNCVIHWSVMCSLVSCYELYVVYCVPCGMCYVFLVFDGCSVSCVMVHVLCLMCRLFLLTLLTIVISLFDFIFPLSSSFLSPQSS